MRLALHHWPQGVLAGCLIVAGGLALWPAADQGERAPPEPPAYRGAVFELRRGGSDNAFPLRSESTASATLAPTASSPPALVGVAGRAVYLRSAANGAVERLTVGAALDGWSVTTVGSRHAVVRGPGGEVRLDLFSSSPNAAGAPSEGAAPPTPAPLPLSAPGG